MQRIAAGKDAAFAAANGGAATGAPRASGEGGGNLALGAGREPERGQECESGAAAEASGERWLRLAGCRHGVLHHRCVAALRVEPFPETTLDV